MAKKISASVGKGGKNKPEDVQLVQELLNGFTKQGGFKKLDVDGLIGPKTNSAIASFQTEVVGMAKADSRVDPGGQTMKTLTQSPSKVAAEAKKAEKAEQAQQKKEEKASKEQTAGGGAGAQPQVKGDRQGVDKKLLAVLEAVSAHYGKPIVIEAGKQSGGPLRTPGQELWNKWCSKLDRGKKEPALKSNGRLRGQLDKLYNRGKVDEFLQAVEQVAGSGGRGDKGTVAHAAGRAVDLAKNTDRKVLAALSTMLRKEDEGDVVHFDDGGKSLPREVTDAMKKKWA